MANMNELIKLFTAIGENNTDLMKKVASQIAEAEFKRGKTSVAQMLVSALEASRTPRNDLIENAIGPVAQFLKKIDAPYTLRNLFCSKSTREELVSIIEEQVAKVELRANGLNPRSKILLYGPPGCGKTLAAIAVANELNLPIYLVQFDALIGSYLGQTAQNLRQLFDFAARFPSVILIDEVDAIAFQRGNPNDVGELNRIVISFMQHLEYFNPSGLIVCSTNLVDSLDSALKRRFEISIKFVMPDEIEKKTFSKAMAKKYGIENSNTFIRKANSYAEIESRFRSEARKKVVASNRKGEG